MRVKFSAHDIIIDTQDICILLSRHVSRFLWLNTNIFNVCLKITSYTNFTSNWWTYTVRRNQHNQTILSSKCKQKGSPKQAVKHKTDSPPFQKVVFNTQTNITQQPGYIYILLLLSWMFQFKQHYTKCFILSWVKLYNYICYYTCNFLT